MKEIHDAISVPFLMLKAALTVLTDLKLLAYCLVPIAAAVLAFLTPRAAAAEPAVRGLGKTAAVTVR